VPFTWISAHLGQPSFKTPLGSTFSIPLRSFAFLPPLSQQPGKHLLPCQ
jgi:hypothetical protein